MASVSIQDMITKLFSAPPQEPKSLLFSFESVHSSVGEETADEIVAYKNNLLMTLFINGSKILFGDTINPATMTESQFNTINKYMQSVGFIAKTEIIQSENRVNIWFEEF
jgi:hypothetical protein